MKETLNQQPSSSQLPESARDPHDGRLKLSRVGVIFVTIMSAVGLALLAWLAITNTAFMDTSERGTTTSKNDLPRGQVALPSGSLQEILAHPDIIPTHRHPLLDNAAPDFELADLDGKVWKLKEMLDDGPVVIIFYYGYHCHACVKQLFIVNADLPLFREVGARVVAISADPPELTRRGFEQNGPFDFPVLSDPGDQVAQAYQTFKRTQDGKLAESHRHGTFLIDRKGTVQWLNVGDAPLRRNPALLYQLAKMEGRLPPTQLGP